MFKKNIVTMSIIPLLSASLLTGCPTHTHSNPPAPQNTNNDEAIHNFIKMLIDALEKKNDTAKQTTDKDTDKTKDHKVATDKDYKKTDKKVDKTTANEDPTKIISTNTASTKQQPITYTAKDLEVFYNDKGLAGFKAKKGGKVVISAEYDYAENFKDDLAVVRKAGKWGFINVKGKIVIPLVYDDLLPVIFVKNRGTIGVNSLDHQGKGFTQFNKNGLLKVQKADKVGVINKQGQIIIPIIYNEIGDINADIISAKKGDKWGFINKQGQTLIDFQYQRAEEFVDGLAEVYKADNILRYINTQGTDVIVGDVIGESSLQQACKIDKKNHFVSVKKANGFYGLFNTQGQQLIDYKYGGCIDFQEELALVRKYTGLGGDGKFKGKMLSGEKDKCKFINKQGQEIIALNDILKNVPSHFSSDGKCVNSENFNNGLAKMWGKDGYGYINKQGETVIELKYKDIGDFPTGKDTVTYVLENGKYGFINKQGQMVIKPQFDNVSKYAKNSNSFMVVKDGKYGFVNKQGDIFIQPQYQATDIENCKPMKCELHSKLSDTLSVVRKNNKVGVIDKLGKVIIPIKYDGISDEVTDKEIAVKKDGKWGFINKQNTIIIPLQYDDARNFNNGLSAVKQDGKWGFINQQGKMVIKPQYNKAENFNNGVSAVKQSGKWGFINQQGKMVIKPQYDKVYRVFDNGVVLVKKADKYFIIDKHNVKIADFPAPNLLDLFS